MPASTGPLAEYRRKRRFAATPEPSPRARARAGSRYAIQRHEARRLHYDLRLERGGVLWSWAVPRGLPATAGERRLAVRTEDHPLDYIDFAGDIPHGHYGGGHVELWDSGTWRPIDPLEPTAGSDRFVFELVGGRSAGRYALVRTGGRGDNKRDVRRRWLIVRLADAPDGPRAHAPHGATEPATMPPDDGFAFELARPAPAPPADGGWTYEIKFDGYRALAIRRHGIVRLLSRGRRMLPVPEVAAALAKLPEGDFVLDGELVVPGADGRQDFSAVGRALGDGGNGLVFVAFDLLWRKRDLRAEPFKDRRVQLKTLLRRSRAKVLTLSPVLEGTGDDLLRKACAQSLEGLIAKRGTSAYTGTRSGAWLKLKCRPRDEFIVVGYTHEQGRDDRLGALLLAAPDARGQLVYRGRVGTGFGAREARSLLQRLAPLARPLAALALPRARGVVPVAPEVVVAVDYHEVTADGLLRQASYAGVREEADRVDPPTSRQRVAAGVTNAGRVVVAPDVTKGEVAAWYARQAPAVLRDVAGRRLSLVRAPDGATGETFFQRHRWPGLKRGVRGDALVAKSAEDLAAYAQFGAIEIHAHGSHADRPTSCDRLVFDLDPGEGVDWPMLRDAALDLERVLRTLGLRSHARVSGGKGLHVIVPLAPPAPWPLARRFARAFATRVATLDPARFVAVAGPAKRRGRIFVDWLRNGPDATAVATGSVRARDGAPVAWPVAWRSLTHADRLPRWTVRDRPPAWPRGWGVAKQSLSAVDVTRLEPSSRR